MTSRFEKERAKQIQDKCQDLLTQMLRDEDNKYCVDCDAKGPRWASWNLGIFLCIRCAGIHRNLGVHISKVKSVNLDTWTPEQVVSLQQMGNSRARAVYEANLPDSFRRPQTDCSLESFIRAKYEHKKYIAREWVPPPLPKVNWDKELDEEAERQRRRKKEGTKSSSSQNSLPPVKKPEVVPQIPKPRSSVSPKPTRANNSATLDLLGLDAPVNQANANGSSSGDDIFSSFLSATPANTSSGTSGATNGTADGNTIASKTEEENFFNQPAPTPQEKSKMTKDSILALYGTPSHQQSPFGVSGGGMYAQQQAVQQFAQPVQNLTGFGQPNSFTSQPNPMGQLNQLQGQIGMPVTNQMNITSNQIGLNSNQMGQSVNQMGQSVNQMGQTVNQMAQSVNQMAQSVNQIGTSLHMGAVNHMNGLPNSGIAMQNQMGVTPVASQMMQMQGQSNISSNNGWSGMIAAQNLQPAPGNNPFFNLPVQPQLTTPFATQLPQQMSQMSLGGLGKPTSAALPGQTLSTNLWQ